VEGEGQSKIKSKRATKDQRSLIEPLDCGSPTGVRLSSFREGFRRFESVLEKRFYTVFIRVELLD
jgi:hypothetical protein